MGNLVLVNNTGCDIRMYESEMRASIDADGRLPDELSDIFTLSLVRIGDETRAVLDEVSA